MEVLSVSWMREMLKAFNMLNTNVRGHTVRCVWLDSGACGTHADKGRGSNETRREKKLMDREGHVYACDWLSEFLSHFIFKLNYFIAN
jgi:hypothetical protein